ncbi:DUF3150 domain-containing protein [Klebsiella oxytoca]|uniref:DUF3150 domain-containing protein n=1 Tax=Klebsiella oxytoca TaxID=571 RepID=A0AAP2BJU4_KLEOX|nr:DUF3150 domain-containing protein [Klebsiella oxytoca]MBQ0601684.1 DUF3150 domain-containing protein [Klebsiella oxytoca]
MTIKSNATQVLEQLILVSLSDITSISGRRKLKREDLGNSADLPPDVLVSLGSKKIIDPQLINPFTRKKNSAHALCLEAGIKFMGGYAIPADKVNDLIGKLNVLKGEFYDYKKEFMKADFNSWINSFEEKYRSILLRDAAIDLSYMDSQIQFGFTAIHITPYGNSVIQDGLTGQVKSLADEVYEDVADVVEGFLKNRNPDAFSQHTLNPLRRCGDKLASLAFIAPSVQSLSDYVNQVMKDIPLTGKVTGKPYNDILSLLNNLRDPIHAKQFVELLSSASTTDGNDAIDPSLSMNLIGDDDAMTLAAISATQVQVETLPPPHTDAFASAVVVEDPIGLQSVDSLAEAPSALVEINGSADTSLAIEPVNTSADTDVNDLSDTQEHGIVNDAVIPAFSAVIVDDDSFLGGDSIVPRSLPDSALISGLDSEKVIDGKEPEIVISSSLDDDETIMVF